MTTVALLMSGRHAYRQSVEIARQKLGPEATLHLVSWNLADFPLDDLVDSHRVVSPALFGQGTVVPPPPAPVAAAADEDDRADRAHEADRAESIMALDENPAGSTPAPARHDPAAEPEPTPAAGSARRRPRIRGLWRVRRLVRQVKRSPVVTLPRRVFKGGLARQFARACRREPTRQVLVNADVVVACDTGAILAAWKLAHRDHRVAVYGVDAGERVLTRLTSSRTRSPSSS